MCFGYIVNRDDVTGFDLQPRSKISCGSWTASLKIKEALKMSWRWWRKVSLNFLEIFLNKSWKIFRRISLKKFLYLLLRSSFWTFLATSYVRGVVNGVVIQLTLCNLTSHDSIISLIRANIWHRQHLPWNSHK